MEDFSNKMAALCFFAVLGALVGGLLGSERVFGVSSLIALVSAWLAYKSHVAARRRPVNPDSVTITIRRRR